MINSTFILFIHNNTICIEDSTAMSDIELCTLKDMEKSVTA